MSAASDDALILNSATARYLAALLRPHAAELRTCAAGDPASLELLEQIFQTQRRAARLRGKSRRTVGVRRRR
ncbi:MAG: hypothetical protein MI924_19860 [Chloroflexales bacterium]|nr:hypothetical protein [Chloroflexales bacterium]